MYPPTPDLSVVLTVVDGGNALRRCLSALVSQHEPPSMEVLIPWDSTIASTPSMVGADAGRGDRLAIRCLDLGHLTDPGASQEASLQHELIDRRRAAGLAAARGGIIAILEDRSVPRPTWAAAIARLHAQFPHAVIGGAVETGRSATLNRAVYFCDFGRYQLPFEAGTRTYVTDVNVSYKRRALERTQAIWRERYHEPLVHWALERNGETLYLSPEPVVDQIRDSLTLTGLLAERVAWGRMFGALRVRQASPFTRLALIARSPLVPAVLFGRFLRDRMAKRVPLRSIVAVSPAVAVLLAAWVLGEAMGYVTGRSGPALPAPPKSP